MPGLDATMLALLILLGLGVFALLIFEQSFFLLVVALSPYALNPWFTTAVGVSATPIVIPLLGVSVLGRRLVRGLRLVFPRLLIPAVAFLGVALLSTVYAADTIEALLSVERTTLRVVLLPYLAWLLIRSRPPEEQARFIGRITSVLTAVAFIGGVIAFAQFAWKQGYWLPDVGAFLTYRRDYLFRPIALAESPTTWGIFLVLPASLAISRLASGITSGRALMVAFFAISLALSGTRSAWAGMLVALVWLVAIRWRRPTFFARVAVTLSLIFILVILVAEPVRDAVVGRIAVREEGLEAREAIIGAGLRIVARHPLTGVGAGNFAAYVAAHPEIVTVGDVPYVIPEEGFQSHSTLLGVWAETGIAGLAMFIWLLAAFWKAFSRSARRLRDRAGLLSPFLVDGMQAAYLALLVASLAQRIDEYLFVWLIPSLALMTLEHTRAPGLLPSSPPPAGVR